MVASSLFTINHESVVVTGAGSGIGRAVALALAESGVTVYGLGRREHALAETVALASKASGRVVALQCDVTDADHVDRTFRTIETDGQPTGLVHAAAEITKASAEDISPIQFEQVVRSGLLGSFNVLRRWALPLLRTPHVAAAVMVTSNSASRGTPGVAHSSAAKAGVEALTKSLGREWGPHGITVNAVGPGVFPIEKSAAQWATPSVSHRMAERIALGRYGELHEIVAPVIFLLSSGATYITGHTLRVDGGLALTPWSVTPTEIASGINNHYSAQADGEE